MYTLTLENPTLRLDFSCETGALIGLTVLRTGWQILNRPHLGLSFRLMLPMPGRRNNNVFGEKQKVASVDAGAMRSEWSDAVYNRVLIRALI